MGSPLNVLPFEYLVRGTALGDLHDSAYAQAIEQRDVELEDFLGRLTERIRLLEDRVAVLETP